ncbi:MAG: ABC transporter ATP-binding protein [Olegusella sp.]|nr:ABC transporter ATP-binding protein [Olegusella sp.]
MQATDSYVDISKLYKAYGQGDVRVDVLNGIDVAVERGEMCVLLGPSGSGKSTFLNLLGGLEAADHGSIRVNGTDICQLAGRDLVDYRRRELGFVFQFYNLLPDLTIRENVEVCAHLAQDPLDVDDLLDRLGILAQAKKFPRQVSGGQQQRCAIARALAKRPGLLLCDEPTGALDYETSLDVLGLLEQVNDEFGCTMVIVTHNDAIARMSHRVLRLREGQIVKNEVNESRVHARDLVW